MSSESDSDLVKLAANGDNDAFRSIVERYQRKVFGICYSILKHPDDAMDASQEVFVKVFRALKKYNEDATFYTWLYRITRNHCIDILRKTSRRNATEFNEDFHAGQDSSNSDLLILPSRLGVDPSEHLRREELRKKMLEAFDSLSENHRTILILREVEGLSYEEIAEVLDIQIGTVMSRLFHARKKFQEAIMPYLVDGSG